MTVRFGLGPALLPGHQMPHLPQKAPLRQSWRLRLRCSTWLRLNVGEDLWVGWSPFHGTVWIDKAGLPQIGRRLKVLAAVRAIVDGRRR